MDLEDLTVDEQKAFCEKVWSIARLCPAGKVVTYGQIAGYIPPPAGVPEETYKSFRARWAGTAMAGSPNNVPWQRVINAQGMISLRRGAEGQRRLLEAEGVVFDAKERVDLAVYGWSGPSTDWLEENGLVPPLAPTLF
jgi:methylated-DNA-protein-cysteine methyltransferase related protein